MAQLDDMALYASAVQAGSFTAAARSMALPLSTVSRRIAVLEQALDTRLLERTTRSLKMTEAGQVFFLHCQKIVQQARDAEQALQHLKSEPCGHIRVAVPFSVDDSWASVVLSSFLVKYPKISIEAILKPDGIDPDDERMDVLVDFGVRPITHHPVVPLGSAQLALFASPRYLQRSGVPRAPEELESHDMVRLTSLSWPEHTVPEFRNLKPNYRVTTNELLMARLACIDGLGIAWLPLLSCARCVQQGLLVQVMAEYRHQLPVWLVYRSASRSAPKVALLAEHLASLLGSAAAWQSLERGELL